MLIRWAFRLVGNYIITTKYILINSMSTCDEWLYCNAHASDGNNKIPNML